LYIANTSTKGLLKIGASNNIQRRLAELGGSGTLEQFSLLTSVKLPNGITDTMCMNHPAIRPYMLHQDKNTSLVQTFCNQNGEHYRDGIKKRRELAYAPTKKKQQELCTAIRYAIKGIAKYGMRFKKKVPITPGSFWAVEPAEATNNTFWIMKVLTVSGRKIVAEYWDNNHEQDEMMYSPSTGGITYEIKAHLLQVPLDMRKKKKNVHRLLKRSYKVAKHVIG